MRVLLFEDDEATRILFRECLSAAGHIVVECGTLDRARTALRTSKIDLLVIDLFIGEQNSLGLAQFAGYAAPDAEIILVTGSDRFAHGELLSEFPGVTWVLRKPLLITDLEAVVSYAEKRAA